MASKIDKDNLHLHFKKQPVVWSYAGFKYRPKLCRKSKRPKYRHVIVLPDKRMMLAPFPPGSVAELNLFTDWLKLGCPPAEPFEMVYLSASFVHRLCDIGRELSIEIGQWDLLATMERLTRTV